MCLYIIIIIYEMNYTSKCGVGISGNSIFTSVISVEFITSLSILQQQISICEQRLCCICWHTFTEQYVKDPIIELMIIACSTVIILFNITLEYNIYI